ncbi:MAG: hypothetical protein K9N49_04800, partial [Candidatus Marinimicrobia bacterium]|nr:hypothetical protein [Candidatus Neomarinimicrobiota bacterium]
MRRFRMGWLAVWALGTLGLAGGALWGGWRAADYRALWHNAEGRITALEDQLRREQSQRQRIVAAPVPVANVPAPAEPPAAPAAPNTADAARVAELERELARREALIEALR